MALLYSWATKDYLLWHMSIGQIVLYHNLGIEMKYGKRESGSKRLRDMPYAEVLQARKEARRQLGLPETGDVKAKLAAKYGAVE